MNPQLQFALLRRFLQSCLAALCLASLPATAEPLDELAAQTWIQAESRHFRIVTDQPEATARRLLTDLETLRYISSNARGVDTLELGPPLTILALGKRGSFKRLGLRDSVGGVFTITRNGYSALANVEGYESDTQQSTPARSILLHEYHHFLMRITPVTLAMPMWYDEGMAEYWSSLTIEDGHATFGRPVDGMYRESYLFNGGGTLSFNTEQLFNRRDLKRNGTIGANDAIGRFYAQARYAVHYFLSTPELRRQLDRYLALYNEGIGQENAARLAFGKPYADLNRDIVRYLKRNMAVRGYKIGKDGLDFPPIDMRVTTLDQRAVWSVFAEVLPRYGEMNPELSRAVLDHNRKINPDDPNAHYRHEVHLGSAGHTNLEALTQRFPDHAGLLSLYAESVRTFGEALRGIGADGWTEQLKAARALFLRANQADPANILAFYGLGEVHHSLPGADGLQDGIVSMDTATLYERDADTYRKLARMHLRAASVPAALAAMRGALAFAARDDAASSASFSPASMAHFLDIALLENLEVLHGPVAAGASVTPAGLAWPDGSTYRGAVQDNKPAGDGRYTRLSGSFYEGPFANGVPHGQGKLVSHTGLRYEGSFERGVARGSGRVVFPAGGVVVSYQGEVMHALPAGTGVLTLAAGRYEGQFSDGVPHGTGVMTAATGVKLSGTWRFGNFDWPAAAGNLLFTGPVSIKGERDSKGWCRTPGDAGSLHPCRYRDGKPAPLEADQED